MLNDLMEKRNTEIIAQKVQRFKKRLSRKKGIFEDVEKEEKRISEILRKKEEKSDKNKPLLDKISALVAEAEAEEGGNMGS